MKGGAWTDYLPSFMRPAAALPAQTAEELSSSLPSPAAQADAVGTLPEGKDALTPAALGGRRKTGRRGRKQRKTRRR